MSGATMIGSRGPALVLVIAGLLAVLGSFLTWGVCPTTGCGGPLPAVSFYSGFDLGFGFVTATAGFCLAVIGVRAIRQRSDSRLATVAAFLSLLIVVTAAASVVLMYVIPGDDKDYYGPPSTSVLMAIVGLIGVAASLRLRRTLLPATGRSM